MNQSSRIQLTGQLLCLLLLTSARFLTAQTLGGNSAYNFLKLPNTPQLSALGGINISNISNDLGLSFNNPSLLRPEMDQQLHVSFNSLYAGVKNYHAMYAFQQPDWETNFSAGVYFIDYGSIPQTDPAGNILGTFRPSDYSVQLAASRHYAEKWYYGASLKFIQSNYGLYRSSALALDVGVSYYDSTRLLQVSLLMKNMGTPLKNYLGSRSDDLPFDLEVGITKRLQKAPIQFSFTAHHLHQFNTRYNDSSFNNDNGLTSSGSFTFDKIFQHFIFAAQVFVTEKLELTLGYNHQLRQELSIANSSNGLTGFSLGVGILLHKIQLRYARSGYQNNTAYNQFGLNIPFGSR